MKILEEARQLKNLAIVFLYPEIPIRSDGYSFARCYFDRFSAPQRDSFEDVKDAENSLRDAMKLKQLARDYLNPEVGVVTSDATTYGRCYFDRYSAIEQESVEESEERAAILEDAKMLKHSAKDYLHPEVRVITSDPACLGRCYFSRYSSIEQESVAESEERVTILEDAMKLKQLARDYLHPEEGIVTSDVTAYGRCYFGRYSAIEQEYLEESVERAAILEDAMKLRQLARDYLNVEKGVSTSSSTSYARCYFSRFSSVEQDTVAESEERVAILEDAMKLKKLARHYFEPEQGVTKSDANSFGRNYFNRYSAVAQQPLVESEEQQKILADALNLKKIAMDYMHPEVRIVTSDLAACARCYFDRISAVRQESFEEAEEQHRILVDAMNLKLLADKVTLNMPKKNLVPKTVEALLHGNETKLPISVSDVHLHGLDDDFAESSYF